MSNQESDRNRRIVGWGIIGFMAVIGVSIALSLYLAPWRTGGLSYSFFPFHFGWVGGIFLIFIVFWIARWFFWPWRGGGGGYYSHPHQQRPGRGINCQREICKGRNNKGGV